MVDESRPQGDRADDPPADHHYFGPFGPPAPDDAWRPGSFAHGDTPHGDTPRGDTPHDDTPRGDTPRGDTPHDHTQPIQRVEESTPGLYPAPAGVLPLQPPPSEGSSPSSTTPPTAGRLRRPMRGAGIVAVAGVTALVIGSAAGFGGAKLAGLDPAPPSAAPAVPSAGTTRAPLDPAPHRADVVEVAKTAVPSTVMIRAGSSGSRGSTGSGFVLDTEGRIMTNNHVVAGAADEGRVEVVFNDGSRQRATVIGRSPSYDLAVIKVAASADLVPMPIGDSNDTRVGETVIAVGAPLALAGSVTSGIVSSKDRAVVVKGSANADAASAYINAIQTDTSINPGNSGGPLVDGGARVIGVNSAILTLGQTSGQSGNIGLGFAIPINQAMDIGALLIKDGKATYPVIGANVGQTDDGVRLTSVDADGPADDAGLRDDDVVTEIDGVAVSDIEKLIVAIRTHRPGDVVKLGYERDGTKAVARVTLGGREG